MISRDILRQIVIQQRTRLKKTDSFIERSLLPQLLESLQDNRVIVLAGIRRSGKSVLLGQIMHRTSGYAYINFEDERLLRFYAEDFEVLNEVLIEVYGQPWIYFFDEVQNIDRFETFVRRLQDDGKKVVITGSNASLLSAEFGTRLTGRYRLFEVYPFSFIEYLDYHKFPVHPEAPYVTEERVLLFTAFQDYLESGGMPEYLRNHDPEYIRTLYDNLLYRDIINRYAIRRTRTVRELVAILSSTVSLPFTYNSLKTALGLKNAITVKEYITYLGNSYLFFELLKMDFSLKRQLNSPRKIYCIDTAFCRLTGFSLTPDSGKMLENVVFVELKRRNEEIFYYSGKRECDFIIKEGNTVTSAVQVCHELNEGNRERETGGLIEAMRVFGVKEGLILTSSQEDHMEVEGMTIVIEPAWKWFLNQVW